MKQSSEKIEKLRTKVFQNSDAESILYLINAIIKILEEDSAESFYVELLEQEATNIKEGFYPKAEVIHFQLYCTIEIVILGYTIREAS